jgi:hypothetical protein
LLPPAGKNFLEIAQNLLQGLDKRLKFVYTCL